MKKKPSKYQAEVIKSALVNAQNEALRNRLLIGYLLYLAHDER